MIGEAAKVCRKCGETKGLEEYGTKRSSRDGKQSRCKPCIKIDKAASHARHRERYNEISRAHYQAHRAERIARQVAWKKANPDKVAAYGRIWRQRNPGRDAEDTRRWIAANPERAAENFHRNTLARRARLAGARVGPVDLDALWDAQEGLCGICGDEIDRSVAYPDPLSKSVDHIVPLSKGGAHEQPNLQWAHLVCNIRKGASAPQIRRRILRPEN